MILHLAFFQTLGALGENDPAWRPVFAGFAMLRLVDSFTENAQRARETETATIRSARLAADSIPEGDPTREILRRIISLLDDEQGLTPTFGRELLSYGRALDLEARWPLAADVFQTIAVSFCGPENIELVIEASTALGAAARSTGDWKTSDRGYAQAQHLADTAHNRPLSLTVRVGIAGSHLIHGNLPAAEDELQDVVADARKYNLQQVEALAIHAQATVAHNRGDYQRAVHLGYRSLELTTNKIARERVLIDIAAAYAGLGMNDTARDGYSIVAITSPHQWVRWQATINLMELAGIDGEETVFDDYVRQLNSAPLDPRLKAHSLYFQGLGLRRFGRENSEGVLCHARDYATQHQMHQLAFEIERSLEFAQTPSTLDNDAETVLSGENSEELQRIAEFIEHLREDAGTKAG